MDVAAATAAPNLAGHPRVLPLLPAPMLKKIDQASKSFEGMFMAQMMQFVWTDSDAGNNVFSGGHAEEMWHGMMTQEMGKIAGNRGDMGVAGAVRAQMIHLQQLAMPVSAAPAEATATDLSAAPHSAVTGTQAAKDPL